MLKTPNCFKHSRTEYYLRIALNQLQLHPITNCINFMRSIDFYIHICRLIITIIDFYETVNLFNQITIHKLRYIKKTWFIDNNIFPFAMISISKMHFRTVIGIYFLKYLKRLQITYNLNFLSPDFTPIPKIRIFIRSPRLWP